MQHYVYEDKKKKQKQNYTYMQHYVYQNTNVA